MPNYKSVVLAIISKLGKGFLLYTGDTFAQRFPQKLPCTIPLVCFIFSAPHAKMQAPQGQEFLYVVSYMVGAPSHTASGTQ